MSRLHVYHMFIAPLANAYLLLALGYRGAFRPPFGLHTVALFLLAPLLSFAIYRLRQPPIPPTTVPAVLAAQLINAILLYVVGAILFAVFFFSLVTLRGF